MTLSIVYMLDKSDDLLRVKYDGKEIGFQMEQLYIEVLYTIANTVGASTGQYAHYKEDLYRYAQEAFGVPQDQHRRYLNIASEEKVCQLAIFIARKGSPISLLCSRKMRRRSIIIGAAIRLNETELSCHCSRPSLC